MKKILIACLSFTAASLMAQDTFDYTFKAPASYEAEFRLRLPVADGAIRYVLVWVPGYKADGRGFVSDGTWKKFAAENHCAILACRFTIVDHNKTPHYAFVKPWAGEAVLDTLKHFAKETNKPELATAPILIWGHSAGGGFAYNFANWKPERVAGFVYVKSGVTTEDARGDMLKVPGLMIAGELDTTRNENILLRYTNARKRDALMCYAFEPKRGHEMGQSGVLARDFFRGVIAHREAAKGVGSPDISWVGDIDSHEIFPKNRKPMNAKTPAWLPDEGFANVWKTFVTGEKINAK